METLANDYLQIAVSPHGAELTSIQCGDVEYLWNADPQFWKRHSPVLFPIVGSVWNGTFRVDGKEYQMGQHGFARDMDFTLVEKSSDSIMFVLESSEATLSKYPFPFRLQIGYRLASKSVEVIWKVTNTGDTDMPFQIGAHPAFFYPQYDPATDLRGSFDLTPAGDAPLEHILIGGGGCADVSRRYQIDSHIEIHPSTFDHDALIFDRSQVKRVTLNAPDGTPWLSLSFDAPLVGLWSPVGKNAPFVCIEPWYGRCDRMEYAGEYKDKDEIQSIAAGETFCASYTIELH